MVTNQLDRQLQQIKDKGRIGLMTHVVIGYPTLKETVIIVKTMAESGVDFIELQIPFSDPLADGPTIMKACEESLRSGTKVKDAFSIMRKLTREVSIPLLFMAYYNTVFKYGVGKFCRDAASAGASGLIVPDMPIEEENNEHFYANCQKYNLHAIHVVSPASTDERLKINARHATGFVYAAARQGITGAKGELEKTLSSYITKINNIFMIPIAVGFGISKKEHIQALKGKANIAVIGSAVIDVIDSSDSKDRERKVRQFLKKLKS